MLVVPRRARCPGWCAIVVRAGRARALERRGRSSCCSGTSLAAPAVSVTIVVLCVVSASAALAMATRSHTPADAGSSAGWPRSSTRAGRLSPSATPGRSSQEPAVLAGRRAPNVGGAAVAERQATREPPSLFLGPESPGVARQQIGRRSAGSWPPDPCVRARREPGPRLQRPAAASHLRESVAKGDPLALGQAEASSTGT